MKTTSEITIKKTDHDWMKELSEPKNAVVQTRQGGGGKQLSYIAGKWYIERLNVVLGENWSWEVVSIQPTGISYIVHGRLTVDGVSRDGIGGADLKFSKTATTKTPVDVSPEGFENTVKSAETDAFKRACEKFGLGLFLSVDDSQRAEAQTNEQQEDNFELAKSLLDDPTGATDKEKQRLFALLTTEQKKEIVALRNQKLLNNKN